MKPGDLVRLRGNWPGRTVAVCWVPPGDRQPRGVPYSAEIPCGTPAVFIGQAGIPENWRAGGRRGATWILVEGRQGWVWQSELEGV